MAYRQEAENLLVKAELLLDGLDDTCGGVVQHECVVGLRAPLVVFALDVVGELAHPTTVNAEVLRTVLGEHVHVPLHSFVEALFL